jgi:hypothetical protein
MKPQSEHFSAYLQILIDSFVASPGPNIPLGEIEKRLQDKGVAALMVVLALPFVQPIPIPGVSIVLGLILMSLGLKVVLGEKGRLPKFLAKREIPERRLEDVLRKILPTIKRIEKLFKPRWHFFFQVPAKRLIGLFIILGGLALSMPLPPVIPLSNSIPAWSILCLSLGLMERDGLLVCLGFLAGIGTWVYFWLWFEAIKMAWVSLLSYFS